MKILKNKTTLILKKNLSSNIDKTHSRNNQWDLMRAFGIIFVVWGHNYQPPYLFFPAFFFHMSLFFFISGYFFKPQITITDKFKYFLKKTRNQLIPYFILNLFFGLLTMWLKGMSINLGQELNLRSMFIAPFGRGDQFSLYLAAWFLFNLYFISVFAGIVYQKSTKVNIGIIVTAIITMLIFLHLGTKQNFSMWTTFASRSIFGFGFFSLGFLFKLYEHKILKYVVKPVNIVVLYLLINYLNAFFGNISYSILSGTVSNTLVFVPVITSICIILWVYIITFYITKIVKPHALVFEIGRYSFSIMVWHLTFFFLVNVLLYNMSLIPFSALSDVYFRYDVEKLWLLYQAPAILLPVLMERWFSYMRKRLKPAK